MKNLHSVVSIKKKQRSHDVEILAFVTGASFALGSVLGFLIGGSPRSLRVNTAPMRPLVEIVRNTDKDDPEPQE